MTYPQNFEEKIGFDKIRGLICDRCLSTLGSERVAGMQFQTSTAYYTKPRNLPIYYKPKIISRPITSSIYDLRYNAFA